MFRAAPTPRSARQDRARHATLSILVDHCANSDLGTYIIPHARNDASWQKRLFDRKRILVSKRQYFQKGGFVDNRLICQNRLIVLNLDIEVVVNGIGIMPIATELITMNVIGTGFVMKKIGMCIGMGASRRAASETRAALVVVDVTRAMDSTRKAGARVSKATRRRSTDYRERRGMIRGR